MLFGLFCYGASSSVTTVRTSSTGIATTMKASNTTMASNSTTKRVVITSSIFVNASKVNVEATSVKPLPTFALSPSPAPINPLDLNELNYICSTSDPDALKCLNAKLTTYTSVMVEWYVLLIANVIILVVGIFHFWFSKLKEAVMNKQKIRTNGLWAKASFVAILPMILFNFLILMNPRIPTTCTYLPTVAGLAMVCVLSVHFMSLMRIVLRIFLVKPELATAVVVSNNNSPDVEDVQNNFDYEDKKVVGNTMVRLIDYLTKFLTIGAIILELIIAGSMANTNPCTIAKFDFQGGATYLLTCAVKNNDQIIGFAVPKILLLFVVLFMSIFLINNPQYFATTKLDDVPEAREDIVLALKTTYFTFNVVEQ